MEVTYVEEGPAPFAQMPVGVAIALLLTVPDELADVAEDVVDVRACEIVLTEAVDVATILVEETFEPLEIL